MESRRTNRYSKLMKIYAYLLLLSFIACSSPKPVYNQSGQLVMQHRGREQAGALDTAMADAEEVCEDRKQNLMIIDKKVSYYGDLPEAEYQDYLRLARISTGVGHEVGYRVGGATYAAIRNCGYEAIVTYECRN
jgi:hypothetical protein